MSSDNEGDNTSDESSRSPSPKLLPPTQGEIDIVLNGKSSSTLAGSALNVNATFDEFIERLDHCISKKTRQQLDAIQDARKIYRYIWMTKAKSQQKMLPRYTEFEGEEQYEALQKAIRTTTKKNADLDDMILRFHVAVRIRNDDEEENDEEHVDEPSSPPRLAGRQVHPPNLKY